jgi:hypothetical protein
MKLLFPITFVLMTCLAATAQINMEDSTVQAIGYWDKNEKQSYSVTTDKFKLKGTDTTSKESMKYEVDITILDSTAKTYTIEWFYKNFSMETDNELIKKIMSIAQDMKVIIKTDENGAFTEVVNWKEVRDYIRKATDKMKEETKDIPKMEAIINQLEATYSTKEAIESAAIKDIQQFYTFHGAKYKLGETLEGKIKVPNIFGGEPFDCDFSLSLDEINEEDNNYIMLATQTVDKEQLIHATNEYLVALSKKLKIDPPKKEDLKDLQNETTTASRIHGSGWIVYSVQTQTVTSDNLTNVEECAIEIK